MSSIEKKKKKTKKRERGCGGFWGRVVVVWRAQGEGTSISWQPGSHGCKRGAHSEHRFPAPSSNSARFSYANEGALFISAQLSTDAVSALRKV